MPSNNSNIETTQTAFKFIKDLNESFYDGKLISFHKNGMFQAIKGNDAFSVNEPANSLCITLPYKFLGSVKLSGEQRHLVISGDGITSEIGIANTLKCEYKKLAKSKCFGFTIHPVTGFLRINQDGEEEVILTDGYTKDKIINLSDIPYTYTIDDSVVCDVKEYTNDVDCDKILLNPSISAPCIQIDKSASGNLPDGVYFISIAYSINNVRFSDYYGISLPVQINNRTGTNSISVNLSNLDRDFDSYQVLLTGVVKGVTTHKIIGKFPTSQSFFTISDWINEEYQDGVPSTELTISKKIYDNTGILAANSQYLFRADVKRKPVVNYQKQAFDIKAVYYVKQVPLKYYKNNGEDIGYFRNENYNFVIRFYHSDGEKTHHYHIPNRIATSIDNAPATGKDIFELDKNNAECDIPDKVPYWQAYNTASPVIGIKSDFKCEERIVGYGTLGYNESIYNFPDNTDVFGERACTPISNFRMPDESKCPRYSVINGEIYINILGVKFLNIEHPKDENGDYIKSISHYEILRSERDENNSTVVSRGIITNMGQFVDEKDNNKTVLYSNFPFNSLHANSFISKTQTYKSHSKESNFKALDFFYNDKFTYYSPHGNYFGRKKVDGYLEVETEERGTAKGYFEETYNHPKHKLVTNFALYFSLVAGAIESYVLSLGNRKKVKNQNDLDYAGATQGTYLSGNPSTISSIYPTLSSTTEDSVYSFPDFNLKDVKAAQVPVRVLLNALKTLVALGMFIYSTAKFAFVALNSIRDLSAYRQYARQYNGVVLYNDSKPVKDGNKRRKFLRQPFYLDNGIHSIGDLSINNGGRNSSIFMETTLPLDYLKDDNTRKSMSELNITPDSKKEVKATSSVYYATVKKHNPGQYGTIEGVKPVKIHTCLIETPLVIVNDEVFYESPVLFGGDCIITEQSHINKFPLFRQTLSNTEYRDGIEYDYRLYNNIGYPRYWFDSTDYDMGNLIRIFGKSKPTIEKLPNQKYNLDGEDSKSNKWIQEDQCIYTSINGVMRYIVEVAYNISFRDNKDEGKGTNIYQYHYSDEFNNLSDIFRSDLQVKPESFQLDPSYQFLSQKYVSSEQLMKLPKRAVEEKNTVLYSLPSSPEQSFNNWRYFSPLNRFSFDERDYGELTGVHSIDQDRILFLFSKASPFLLNGQDELQTKNSTTITLGDAGLFARTPREMNHTDVSYGSNHDRYAFKSTQFGHFYVSELQGKLFNFKGNLDEYSREGWQKWCAEFIPLRLKREFPDYKNIHNPITGVGYQIGYDNIYETIYISKKDYSPLSSNVSYNSESDKWYFNDFQIELGDPLYFEDCSLTLSYCPALQSFQSFHSWIPDAFIQEERHFLTAKDNTLWKHNERTDLFCNFYGKDYSYDIAVTVSTGQNVNILGSVEYFQEAYKYKTDTLDRYHVYNETFDHAIISNSEQLSGLLHLNDVTNIRYDHEIYPRYNSDYSIEIPYKKAENKFRFNMFYDYTKDRGRFNNIAIQPFITKKNGTDFIINPAYLNFTIKRPPRFRHYFHTLWLSREISNDIQFITKFANTKLLLSPR